MSWIVEKVAIAVHADGYPAWDDCSDIAKAHFRRDARAAIKATLEHLRDNQSKEMIEVGNSEIDDCIDFWNYDSGAGYCVEQRAARTTMAAMLSQAITELNEEA